MVDEKTTPVIQGDYNSEVSDVLGPQSQADGYADPQPPRRTIIGLTGHARSGKDTAGQYLVENYGFTRIGLADGVREALYALNPVHYDEAGRNVGRIQDQVDKHGWDYVKGSEHVRELIQRMGTEAGREIHGYDCWINLADRKVKALGPKAKVVVTDVRFPNEAEWVKALGGEVWEIIRPGFGPINEHASDQKLDRALIDEVFPNNNSIQSFYNALECSVNYLFKYKNATA